MLRYPVDRVTKIYNGFYSEKSHPDVSSKKIYREKYGFSEDETIILFAGSLTERKGVFDLMKAFLLTCEKFPKRKIRLLVAGDGDYKEVLANLKSIWAKVTITGNVSKEQLYDFYRLADMGVIPSYIEQCSYTAIEMMYFSLPLIVSEVDGLKEIIPSNCALKTPLIFGKNKAEVDIDSLQKNILFFVENKEISFEYARRAKEYAGKNFSADRMARLTVNVYNNLFSRFHRGQTFSIANCKSEPLVSVILPVYNTDLYLERCIDSVLKQEWKNFELIIIDDGSVDRSPSIIKSFNDRRIRYVRNATNQGIVKSLNKGLDQVSGKYVARLDSDDIMHKTRLKTQVEFLEKHSDIVLVGSWNFIMDHYDRIIGLKEYPSSDIEIKLLLPFMNPFSHTSIMAISSVVKSMKYSEKYKYCEDYDLWTKLVPKFKTANIPKCLTYYRVHSYGKRQEYHRIQMQNSLEIQSALMDDWNLEHSVEDLIIHGAICFGAIKKLINLGRDIVDVIHWISKVMALLQRKYSCSVSLEEQLKEYLIYDYCGLSLD